MLEHAIYKINPEAKFFVANDDVNEITWLGDTLPISREDILAELENLQNSGFIPPEPWNPSKVWKLFLDSPTYDRINGLANNIAPEINSALIRLALAWKDTQDREFWTHRCNLALINLERALNDVSYAFSIKAHPEDIEAFNYWNSQFSLKLNLPWQSDES